jgi:hypothetical protein
MTQISFFGFDLKTESISVALVGLGLIVMIFYILSVKKNYSNH